MGISDLPVDKLAARFKYRQVEELLAAIGRGEITPGHLANAANELLPRQVPEEPLRPRLSKKRNNFV